MSVTYYSSADSGAPVLNGQAGSLINLLDTLLVGSGTAYGSKPKAGWSKPHSGTSKAVYQTGDGGAYYRVQHDGAQGAASTREAVVRGAELATDVDTLTDPFPLSSQHADANCVWRVSDTVDATARNWWAIANDSWLCLYVQFSASNFDVYMMGRFAPMSGASAWAYLINTRGNANSTGAALAFAFGATTVAFSTAIRLHLMRNPAGTVKSPFACVQSVSTQNNRVGSQGLALPDPSGQIVREPCIVVSNGAATAGISNAVFAGVIDSVWCLQHGVYSGVSRLDTFSDSGYHPDSEFLIIDGGGAGNGKLALEISGTWQSPYG